MVIQATNKLIHKCLARILGLDAAIDIFFLFLSALLAGKLAAES
jgi:hypothetical protein